ncbi:MAG TPA: carbonic anhydrase [Verrucomicrobiae bacterium]|jgi:carbonic anhydrase
MHLFEAIVDANHRAVAGDKEAGLHPDDFAADLPVIALTCIDPRLNAFFPNVLALPAEKFIWLRNAGNIITAPLSSTMRSLALACAVKGGREIAIIGHTDCQIAKTTAMQLLDKLKAVGVDRQALPDNLSEFFGMFGSEQQNIIKGCDIIRHSPLIGPNVPVHGLLLDVETGALDWIVNGYEVLQSQVKTAEQTAAHVNLGNQTDLGKISAHGALKNFEMGEMKFPEMKIGESAAKAVNSILDETRQAAAKIGEQIPVATPVAATLVDAAQQAANYAERNWSRPPRLPVPPPIPKQINVKR